MTSIARGSAAQGPPSRAQQRLGVTLAANGVRSTNLPSTSASLPGSPWQTVGSARSGPLPFGVSAPRPVPNPSGPRQEKVEARHPRPGDQEPEERQQVERLV